MIAALSLWIALSSQPASANFVSYVDEKGTRHIVSSVEEIPEQYREKAKESRAGDATNARQGTTVGAEKRPASSSKGRGGGRGKRKGSGGAPAGDEE